MALRVVSTKLAAATRLSTVWRTALRHCIRRALPIPGIGKTFPMPAREMEWRARRAAYLEKLWTFEEPFTLRKYQFNAHSSGIDQLYLVPGGRCLLTRRGSRLMCWDLGFRSAKDVECIDEWRYVHGLVSTCVVDDEDPTNIVLAVGAWEINQPTLILNLQPLDPDGDVFTELATTQTIGRPVAIRGDILVFYNGLFVGEGDELGINLVNWRHGITDFIPRQDVNMGPCVGVKFHLDLLVVVYQLGFELWTITSPPEVLQRFLSRVPVHGPIGFTSCLSRTLAQGHSKATSDTCVVEGDISSTDIPRIRLKEYPPLTILSSQRAFKTCGLVQIVLQQISESKLPMHFPHAPHLHHNLHFHLVRASTADIPSMVPIIRVGPSGRGVYVANGTLFAFKPISVSSPFGFIDGTPDLEHPKAIKQSQGIMSEWSSMRGTLAFDDAMGRVVVGNEYGAVTVLDCMACEPSKPLVH